MLYTAADCEKFAEHEPQGSFASKLLPSDFTLFASNFKTETIALSFLNKTLVCTVNDKEYDNSPLCSPYNLFCLYPVKRLQTMKNRTLKAVLTGCTTLMQIPFHRAQFNRVVQVNNKPCDAIAYPVLTPDEVKACIAELTRAFPSHALLFPRIDQLTHPELFSALEANGFWMVPTRPVHVYPPNEDYFAASHTKRDLSFLRKTDYVFVPHDEIRDEDLPRIHTLYHKLFVEKHGSDSPLLTLKFFEESFRNRWYEFFALRSPSGVIDAFFSFEIEGKTMACGPLGYDTSKETSLGLYRMLFVHSLRIAKERGMLFNFGGGNEQFKSNRGSVREIAFTAVYCRHLPYWRQIPWWLLGKGVKKLTLKLMKEATF